MRIAYVCTDPGVPVYGRKGCSIHVQEIVRAFLGLGHEVELFATRTGGAPPPGLERVTLHPLPRARGETVDERERSALAVNDDVRRALLQRGPFDVIYERHALWAHAAMELAAEQGRPGLLEVNAPLVVEQRRYRELVNEDLAEASAERSFSAAAALLAVSSGVAGFLDDRSGARGRVHVVPNGVDVERFSIRTPGPDTNSNTNTSSNTDTLTVGFVGTLKPWHGVDLLLEAFAAMAAGRSARLLIVGDGPERETLEARALALGIAGRTTFAGAVDPERVPGLIGGMDIAVAPYPELEAFYFSPLKVFEYMAAGCAIVAADIGQIVDVLDHDRTGVLYAPGNTEALTAALDRLAADAGTRRRLGEAARQDAWRRHTWRSVAARSLDLARSAAGTGLR